MSASESDSGMTYVVPEDETEEEKIYRWIFEVKHEEQNKKEEEEDQTLSENKERMYEDGSPLGDQSEDQKTENKKGAKKKTVQRVGFKKVWKTNAADGVAMQETENCLWRRPGVDISDYFNFGFDEECWRFYLKKQTTLRQLNNALEVQRGCTVHDSSLASSQSGAWDVTEGQLGPSRSFSPTPPVLYRPEPPPPCRPATDSLHTEDSGHPSTSVKQRRSGVSASTRKRMVCSAGVMRAAEEWGRLLRDDIRSKEKERRCLHNLEKRQDRKKRKEKGSSANSREERLGRTSERKNRRKSLERFSKGRKRRERIDRDNEEGLSISHSQSRRSRKRRSSRRNREEGEERSSPRRCKHKKKHRKKKQKKNGSAERERK